VTLRAPPKPPHSTANLVGRFVGLIILLAIFAAVVWVAATNQQIPALERSDPLVNAPGEHLSINGVVLHVRTFGSGTSATLLLHDDSMAGGALLATTAEELAANGRRVVVPDLLGFGLSGRPAEPDRIYSSVGQAETVAALLDDLSLTGVEVVGFGSGGGLAAELTVIRPGLVDRLVMVDTAALPTPSTGWHSLEALPFGAGEAVAHNREGASAQAEQRFRETCPGPAECGDPVLLEHFRKAVTVPGTAASIRARRASDPASVAADRLEEVSVPVLLLSTSDAADVEELAARFDAASVEVVEGTPTSVAAAILAD